MVSQTFLYNAVFFTYSLILTAFYHIPINNVAWYLIPFALGNLVGPLTSAISLTRSSVAR